MPTNTQKWDLPSGNFVKEIYFVNISQCAEVLKKKKTLSPVERSTLRYGMSEIIDLLMHMRNWFSVSAHDEKSHSSLNGSCIR
ncbi:uncharacterized protein OCT59_029394 [Rhizophagus irregularis]|uniref:uncharacterized protein n=1 Tax=Rhizophagus irregularis TaxID=588596 RepID=UPI003326706E|nr:hypothetical protein OCT59_029394 [Rhizophagus irregularis]